jgi:hypothetical protein
LLENRLEFQLIQRFCESPYLIESAFFIIISINCVSKKAAALCVLVTVMCRKLLAYSNIAQTKRLFKRQSH